MSTELPLHPDKSPSWFALTVKPQNEKAVAEQLQSKSLEAYVPLYRARRRWSDRVKILDLPLFPKYVFSRFAADRRTSVLRTPGVTSIVSFDGKPCPVREEEIEAVKMMVGSGMPLTTCECLQIGQRVRICDGAMSGLEGILVREKSGYRVVVNIELLNRAVAVEIEQDLVTSVSGASGGARSDLFLRT